MKKNRSCVVLTVSRSPCAVVFVTRLCVFAAKCSSPSLRCKENSLVGHTRRRRWNEANKSFPHYSPSYLTSKNSREVAAHSVPRTLFVKSHEEKVHTRANLTRWSVVVAPALALLAACSDAPTK